MQKYARSPQEAMARVASGAEVSFCTNRMLDRGTVYDCVVDESGHAIVQRKSSWWAMSYIDLPIEADEDRDLGPVKPYNISGSELYALAVGRLTEGKG